VNQSPRAGLLTPLGGVIVHALLWLALVIGLLTLMPGYKSEFQEHNVELPWATQWAIATHDWLANYWYVIALMFVPLCAMDAAILLVTWRTPRARRRGILWLILMAALPMVLMGMVAFAVWIPHQKLSQGLSR
jgi:type II secretory pathway component PulF